MKQKIPRKKSQLDLGSQKWPQLSQQYYKEQWSGTEVEVKEKPVGVVKFSSQPYSSKKTFFPNSSDRWKWTKSRLVLCKQQSQQAGPAESQDTADPKRIVLMLLDSTISRILRDTHKPAKAHRIPENNQTFIMSLTNTEVTSIRNSVSCCVWLGKENSHF